MGSQNIKETEGQVCSVLCHLYERHFAMLHLLGR